MAIYETSPEEMWRAAFKEAGVLPEKLWGAVRTIIEVALTPDAPMQPPAELPALGA